ncbi:MAG: hypothetical protein JST84_04590 [Acidobacteria bacterium]|nr:hypothetical protein [Acidobacteriota bacterium]
MAARSRQEFFSYLEQMLHEQSLHPGNFLPPLLYLHLLCLPRRYWHASDLLGFPCWVAWQDALFDAKTLTALELRLPQYELLLHHLRDLLIYLVTRPATRSESAFSAPTKGLTKKKRVRISPTEVMALLDNPPFRAFLAEQVRYEARHNPHIRANQHLLDQVMHWLPWAAPELLTRSLTILAQQGWLEIVSATPGKEFFIRLKHMQAPSVTNCA